MALAQTLLAGYAAAEPAERLEFLKALADRFGPDRAAQSRLRSKRFAGSGHRFSRGAARRRRAPKTGTDQASQPCPWWHFRPRADAGGTPRSSPGKPGPEAGRRRFRPPLLVLVQQGLSGLRPIDWTTPANILEKIIRYEAVHAIRELGRPAQSPRAGGSSLLRLLPSAARRRAADLRRSGSYARHSRRRRSAARPVPHADSGRRDHDRGVLLDLEHAKGTGRCLLRQLPDQAGGREPQARAAESQDIRHALAGSRLRRMARPRTKGRDIGLPGCRSTADTAPPRPSRLERESGNGGGGPGGPAPRGRLLLPQGEGLRRADLSIRWRGSISGTARASSD